MYEKDHTTSRRITLIAGIILIALLAIAPVFLLSYVTTSSHQDAAYQALYNFVEAHNGSLSAEHAISADPPSFYTHLESGGTVAYADKTSTGPCWEITVGSGPSNLPVLANSNQCQGVLEPVT